MCGHHGDHCVSDPIVSAPDGETMVAYTPSSDETCTDPNTGSKVRNHTRTKKEDHTLLMNNPSCENIKYVAVGTCSWDKIMTKPSKFGEHMDVLYSTCMAC